MGFFDFTRRGERTKNNINRVPEAFANVGGISLGIANRRYADAYLWLVFNKIFEALRNVRFYADNVGENYEQEMKDLCGFLDTNINNIVWEWWNFGYVAIDVDANGRLYFPEVNRLRFDKNRNITNCFAAIYSNTYIFAAKSSMQILRENIKNLDTIKNGQDYLTRSFGALGILSSKTNPMYDDDKEAFQRKLKKDYGISDDKYQILLFDTDVNFQKLDLPIKDLALDERIKDELKLIAGYFGVPYDLIPFSGASTYANQEQAVKQFYSGCISPLAEIALKIGRYIMKKKKTLFVPSELLTFTIDNVPEIEDDREKEIDYKNKLVDLVVKMEGAGIDATEIREKLK